MSEALGFECSPEAFHGSIIIAAALATHTSHDSMGAKELLKSAGSVLDAAIGVMDLRRVGPKFERSLKSLRDQGSR